MKAPRSKARVGHGVSGRTRTPAVTVAITCSESLAGQKILGRSLRAWQSQARALFAAMDAEPGRRAPRLGAVEIHIADANEMAVLNDRHLKHRGPTDVLTFPLDEPVPVGVSAGDKRRAAHATVSGVVVVCPAVAEAEARDRRLPPPQELLRYILHGALHLLGEDDKSPAKHKHMHARQEKILVKFLHLHKEGPELCK
ncbi:MAG TPA: rRNA maturation RNase YbeY [Planctomycetota bacterium]|nr:rRNA maturation RNase YbeY [Planctomycetota bacterium]